MSQTPVLVVGGTERTPLFLSSGIKHCPAINLKSDGRNYTLRRMIVAPNDTVIQYVGVMLKYGVVTITFDLINDTMIISGSQSSDFNEVYFV